MQLLLLVTTVLRSFFAALLPRPLLARLCVVNLLHIFQTCAIGSVSALLLSVAAMHQPADGQLHRTIL
jgi:hypothetical protein